MDLPHSWPVEKTFDIWPGKNQWRAPDWFSLYGIQLEGPIPPQNVIAEREKHIAELRQGWIPSDEGWQQLQAVITSCMNRWLFIKFYDTIIVELDESEGPEPLLALLRAAKLQTDSSGALQCYLLLRGEDGAPQRGSFAKRRQLCLPADEADCSWVNIADVYEIQVLVRLP
jgi:hypothetical protein